MGPVPVAVGPVPAAVSPAPVAVALFPVSVGPVAVNMTPPLLAPLEARLAGVAPGGRWRPSGCRARHRVAVVIPYRDREAHLRLFLQHMHPFLQKQQLDYGIYVVEQVSKPS